jgi:hypothetical protein
MSAFDANGKRTHAIFVRETKNGRTVYRREQYNLVRYNVDTDGNAKTYMEGLPYPGHTSSFGSNWDDEVYDNIEIHDAPPFDHSRIGRIGK